MGKKEKKGKKAKKKREIIRRAPPKKKKKIWTAIYASKEFGNKQLGETLVTDKRDLIGKTLKYNLMTLTGEMKKQNIKIKFEIKEIKEDKPISEIIGYELLNSYIKRMSRRSRSKIDTSLVLETKDKIKIRIKPLIITRATTKSIVLKSVRESLLRLIKEETSESTYDELIKKMLSHNLQREIKNSLKKIYPIAIAEIRVLKKLSS